MSTFFYSGYVCWMWSSCSMYKWKMFLSERLQRRWVFLQERYIVFIKTTFRIGSIYVFPTVSTLTGYYCYSIHWGNSRFGTPLGTKHTKGTVKELIKRRLKKKFIGTHLIWYTFKSLKIYPGQNNYAYNRIRNRSRWFPTFSFGLGRAWSRPTFPVSYPTNL